ncbi:major facilitator superfamily domain-containing protein [Circinella umbellata]|nr:major facilitator superfamily domain-containing protein [Circinella umbellata]
MSKNHNTTSHSLAASAEAAKTQYINKSDNIQNASIVISQEEDRKCDHFPLSSDDSNSNSFDGEDLHYSRYYKCSIIIISFLVSLVSFGIGNSWGVLQDYFDENVFGEKGRQIPNAGLQLSFVGTLNVCLEHSMAPLSEVIRSTRGAKTVLFLGGLLIFSGLTAASFAKEIWHLYLSQSILCGIGASFLYSTIQTVVPHYFPQNPGFVLGGIASGACIGSLIIPLIATTINNNLGIQWTYRILGCVNLIINLLACMIIKDHPYNTNIRFEEKSSKSTLIRLDVFKNKKYCIWCLSSFTQIAAFYVPLFIIPSYATYIGLSDSRGASLVSIISAAAFVGRISCGFIADRLGSVNISIIYTTISALSCLVIWPISFTYPPLIGFAIVFGLTSGTYYSLAAPITASILKTEQYSSGVTITLLLVGISIFGPSVASAIDSAGVSNEPFFTYKMFTGTSTLVSAVILIWLKFCMKRSILAKV